MAASDSETNGNGGGNVGVTLARSSSAEDLSEYTDADESISAPTEFLAEFLSAVMLKDYDTALKYCKLILHYEPNNATAKEFYPLIIEKLEMINSEQYESDEESRSEDSSVSSSSHTSSSSNEDDDEGGLKQTDSDATTASYSSLEDEEADRENNAIGNLHRQPSDSDVTNGNAKPPASPRRNGTTTKTETKKFRKKSDRPTPNIARSSENSKNSSSSKNKFCTTRNVENSSPKRKCEKIISSENRKADLSRIELEIRPPGKWSAPMQLESPESELSEIGFAIASSDSESPTDPTTQPTIQENVQNNSTPIFV